jgi:hypothetical protein
MVIYGCKTVCWTGLRFSHGALSVWNSLIELTAAAWRDKQQPLNLVIIGHGCKNI